MVFKKTMKRKRKELCPSPLLDDGPKRTKVQAQRKFAAGSNVNSPAITPIREIECELSSRSSVLPEPVELLPMKRPNTEDFLTFLCFRGTPILPPTLNFFNTASIVDTNGQVHEIKSESSAKNGPIDIAKCSGSSSEKPFIAFGVRKRADPIVISRQMDRKRRHALAIAALRRKYQEQKMAKIRALTISKLSEKTTNRTMVKTNTVSKTETVTKKNTTTLQKTKVIATKHVKVTTQTLKTSMRAKIKPKMCLRSFRGRFVQKELPFRRKAPQEKVLEEKKVSTRKKECSKEEKSAQPSGLKEKGGKVSSAVQASRFKRFVPVVQKKIIVTPVASLNSSRVTRSGIIQKIPISTKLKAVGRQIKKRILIAVPTKTIVKPKLRSTTLKKSVISQKHANQRTLRQRRGDSDCTPPVDIKSEGKKDLKSENTKTKVKDTFIPEANKKIVKTEVNAKQNNNTRSTNNDKLENKAREIRSPELSKRSSRSDVKENETISKDNNTSKSTEKPEPKREVRNISVKKETIKTDEKVKKEIKKNVNIRKSTRNDTKNPSNRPNLEVKKEIKIDKKIESNTEITKKTVESVKKIVTKKINNKKPNKSEEQTVEEATKNVKLITNKKPVTPIIKKDMTNKKSNIKEPIITEKESKDKQITQSAKNDDTHTETEDNRKKPAQKEECKKEKDLIKIESKPLDNVVQKETQKTEESCLQKRPSRKTKEAAAIYMEILSHKLVNDGKIDDDNVSIDSFPELPNVKKTEQREIELKAQAKTSSVKQKLKKGQDVSEDDDDEISLKEIKEQSHSKQNQKLRKTTIDPKKDREGIKSTFKKESVNESVKPILSVNVISESAKRNDLIEKLLSKANESLGTKVTKRKAENINDKVEPNASEEISKSKVKKLELEKNVLTTLTSKVKKEDIEKKVSNSGDETLKSKATKIDVDKKLSNKSDELLKPKVKKSDTEMIVPKASGEVSKSKVKTVDLVKAIPDVCDVPNSSVTQLNLEKDSCDEISKSNIKKLESNIPNTGTEGIKSKVKPPQNPNKKCTSLSEDISKSKLKKVGPENVANVLDDTSLCKVKKFDSEKFVQKTNEGVLKLKVTSDEVSNSKVEKFDIGKNANDDVSKPKGRRLNSGKSVNPSKSTHEELDLERNVASAPHPICEATNKIKRIVVEKLVSNNVANEDISKPKGKHLNSERSVNSSKSTNEELDLEKNVASTPHPICEASNKIKRIVVEKVVSKNVANEDISKPKSKHLNSEKSGTSSKSTHEELDLEKNVASTPHPICEASNKIKEIMAEKAVLKTCAETSKPKKIDPEKSVQAPKTKLKKLEQGKGALKISVETSKSNEVGNVNPKKSVKNVTKTEEKGGGKGKEVPNSCVDVSKSKVNKEDLEKSVKHISNLDDEATKSKLEKMDLENNVLSICGETAKSKLRKLDLEKSIKNVASTGNEAAQSKIKKLVMEKIVASVCEDASKSKVKILDKNKLAKNGSSTGSDAPKPKVTKLDPATKTPSSDLEERVEKRKTRMTNVGKYTEEIDSDESFLIDIKVAKKKKIIKTQPKPEKPPTKKEVTPEKVVFSSDSDQSTTSDINLKTLQVKARNKKFSKTKSMKKATNFSDSDEEPLSKLTSKSVVSLEIEKPTVPPVKESGKKTKPVEKQEEKPIEVKPKRECAKRPQNYLPMLSSSEEEEEFFHGFSHKVDVKIVEKPVLVPAKPLISDTKVAAAHVAKSVEPTTPSIDVSEKDPSRKVKPVKKPCYEEKVQHVAPSLDLLGKELGRKNKVNMSNEQIEKWLKDSALAGSSIKKENDAMLKFGIPTDTSLEICEPIDTVKLKSVLLEPKEEEIVCPVDVKQPEKDVKSPTNTNVVPMIDRKLIFRKDKKEATPNVNAFSPENECSIYAFGEEAEEVVSTPFRRPSRRPSSASRSEDESSKHDETLRRGQFRKPPTKPETPKITKDETDTSNPGDIDDSNHSFNVPQNPFKATKSMVPPSSNYAKKSAKTPEKLADEDFKYKIPSSPSASSSSSAKLYKRSQKKANDFSLISTPAYVSDFPKFDDVPKLVEAPVFHPTEHEFQDPLEYIERIRHKSEQFGICRIVPPSSFKPECKVSDDMRFTSYNQYVHKMLNRWGPNFKELMAIKKYLATQNITLKHPPWIGGMEIDLPRLYQTVQSLGGLKEVIEKKKWSKVSDCMKIPKSAQDRVTKLDDIYCKYLLPYDTLSPAEREKLFDEVETEWAKRQSKSLVNSEKGIENAVKCDNEEDEELDDDNDSDDECVVKGRNMALNAFYRIARNTMSMHFKTAEPLAEEVEQEFWKHVVHRQSHICVHSASIDCGPCGFGFAVSKNSPFARHAWNLKVLTNNSGSILRSLGPLMGVTVPTLHVGMVFSACCWSRDPHGLPWVEYLHTGGSKIWYGVPESYAQSFHSALKNLVPHCCRNEQVWLPSDTAMVPPNLLLEHQVSVCRTVQEPGQFVVVFPKAFTSSIATGYVVSESVYFAPLYWLKTARTLFDYLRNSCEQSMFSFDKLIVSVATDSRSSVEVLRAILPHVQELIRREKESRRKLRDLIGEKLVQEKIDVPEIKKTKKQRRNAGNEMEFECEICRMNLFISMVIDIQEELTYCLDHAVELVESKKLSVEKLKFSFTYGEDELDGLTTRVNATIESKLHKKAPSKFSGMATLLNR